MGQLSGHLQNVNWVIKSRKNTSSQLWLKKSLSYRQKCDFGDSYKKNHGYMSEKVDAVFIKLIICDQIPLE